MISFLANIYCTIHAPYMSSALSRSCVSASSALSLYLHAINPRFFQGSQKLETFQLRSLRFHNCLGGKTLYNL